MSGKWWRCRACGWSIPKGALVCYCGNSHDSLVKTQVSILQGQGGYKGKGRAQQFHQPQVGAKGGGGGKGKACAPSTPPSSWRAQRSRQKHAGHNSESSSQAAESPQSETQERIQTLQAVLNSLKGRTDSEAAELRAMSTSQLAKLRLEANEAKSLPQQISILQQVVMRKESVLSEAKAKMEQCMVNLEVSKEKCMAADTALASAKTKLNGLLAKCSSTQAAQQANRQEMTGNQLNSIAQLGNLLPPEMAQHFQVALNQLAQLLQASSAPVDVEDDMDAELIGEDGYVGGTITPAPPHFGSPSSLTSTIPGSVAAATPLSGTAGSVASGSASRGRVPACKLESRSNRSCSRADSADSGIRRRLRGKTQDPNFVRMRSESPIDASLLSGPSYFPPAALATDSGIGAAAA